MRDALPAVSGSQPLLMVFSAGNAGGGDNSGRLGPSADTVETPGTAKNVITVGAIEQLRNDHQRGTGNARLPNGDQ